uniref:Chromo domain-containing protein n=1 Tax=Salix viminalis TaxID=40686 RepID=A0A6N2NAF6_SALVM
MAYHLDLPGNSRIYPVFHVSCLKEKLGKRHQLVEGVLKPEPEEVLERRLKKKKGRAVAELLVRWKGLGAEEACWVEYSELAEKFPNLVDKLYGEPIQPSTSLYWSPSYRPRGCLAEKVIQVSESRELNVTLDTLFKTSILDLRLIDRLDEEEQQLRFTYLLRLAINRFNGWGFTNIHTLSSKALLMVLDGKLKYLYELNVLDCLIKDVDGKDIGAHMDRLRDFKKELLNKACNFKALKKFIHCFGKSCEHCKDKSLASK